MAFRKVTEKEWTVAIEAYMAGKTAKEAAAVIGAHSQGLRYAMKRRGLSCRGPSESHRIHQLDEAFFDEINSEEKAYWLGFITADGCVHGRQLTVGLKKGDRAHLATLRCALQTTAPVSERTKCSRFVVTSRSLCKALSKLGVRERKSLVVKPCRKVPLALLRHYWRGIVDGDGTVSAHRTKRGAPQFRVRLVGSLAIVAGFLSFVRSSVTEKIRATFAPAKNIWRVGFGGLRLPRAICRVLYEGCMVALPRKDFVAQQAIMASNGRNFTMPSEGIFDSAR